MQNVETVEAYVGIAGELSLDAILRKFNLPYDFDLLSIDVDGDDYHIFKNLQHYRPRVVIIEL